VGGTGRAAQSLRPLVPRVLALPGVTARWPRPVVTGGDGIVGTAAAQALCAHQSLDCELHYNDHHNRLRLVHLPVINSPVFPAGRRALLH
jgi:hypothetical protein